ncbi:hypothetical protein BCU69_20860 [Vibrio cyclitrophicus]|uniref:hypothetical protein n=1 Tax=Vibrio cyclitrophicus TaxID=47951 RepID=UPI000C818582|nr:hypothetical protein [Vibrio cyclitrophicus]PMH37932.1 hypothetical protein BCU69_20860 [Vibrio cyclitrophicus]
MNNKLAEIIKSEEKGNKEEQVALFSKVIDTLEELFYDSKISEMSEEYLEVFTKFFVKYLHQVSKNPYESILGETLDCFEYPDYSLQELKNSPKKMVKMIIKTNRDNLGKNEEPSFYEYGCGYFVLKALEELSRKEVMKRYFATFNTSEIKLCCEVELLEQIASIQITTAIKQFKRDRDLTESITVSRKVFGSNEIIEKEYQHYLSWNPAFDEVERLCIKSPDCEETLNVAKEYLRSVMVKGA